MSTALNSTDRATLIVAGGPSDGKTIILAKPNTTMGRLPDSDVVVDEPGVSRRHAEIFHTGDGFYLRDLSTTNGTFLNGIYLGKFQSPLRDGDQICLAKTDISFIFRSDMSKTMQVPMEQQPPRSPD